MRRIITFFAAMSVCAGLSAQTHYVDSENKDMLRPFTTTGAERTEIVLPQVNGYNVYKADLHIHTFYSDGHVS
ncbi:MAG: histidinol-phosphatase, partial [Bacteroidales bacterium]|nr:histidinol-phosphatase [Bacteroidales bacterium]